MISKVMFILVGFGFPFFVFEQVSDATHSASLAKASGLALFGIISAVGITGEMIVNAINKNK